MSFSKTIWNDRFNWVIQVGHSHNCERFANLATPSASVYFCCYQCHDLSQMFAWHANLSFRMCVKKSSKTQESLTDTILSIYCLKNHLHWFYVSERIRSGSSKFQSNCKPNCWVLQYNQTGKIYSRTWDRYKYMRWLVDGGGLTKPKR